MRSPVTASLLVCLAAAGVAIGALALEPAKAPVPPSIAVPPTTKAPYGAGGAGDGATRGGATVAASVQIRDFSFGSVSAAPGATVTVVNADGVEHTATAADGEFDSGRVAGGTSGSLRAPQQPGTYRFTCTIHPSMTGTLTVG